jgi:hypothetical protein
MACSGMAWPKDTVADLRMPPQSSHLGEEKPPTKRNKRLTIGSGSNALPQFKQIIFRFEPCSSTILSSGTPARLCKPSTFCVIRPISFSLTFSDWTK